MQIIGQLYTVTAYNDGLERERRTFTRRELAQAYAMHRTQHGVLTPEGFLPVAEATTVWAGAPAYSPVVADYDRERPFCSCGRCAA